MLPEFPVFRKIGQRFQNTARAAENERVDYTLRCQDLPEGKEEYQNQDTPRIYEKLSPLKLPQVRFTGGGGLLMCNGYPAPSISVLIQTDTPCVPCGPWEERPGTHSGHGRQ